jgi:DNA repair protein RadC
MHLHVKDCTELLPGSLVRNTSGHALHRALAHVSGNTAAQTILDTVGENGLLGLSANDLVRLGGIPRATARRIVAARELGELLTQLASPRVTRSSEILRHLPLGLRTFEIEMLFGVALNAILEVKAVVLLAKGGAHGAAVTPKDVFVPLVRLNAAGVVLAHNHPSGDPMPSKRDVELTNNVTRMGHMLGISVIDHLIIARRGVTSFAEAGLLLNQEELEEAIPFAGLETA